MVGSRGPVVEGCALEEDQHSGLGLRWPKHKALD